MRSKNRSPSRAAGCGDQSLTLLATSTVASVGACTRNTSSSVSASAPARRVSVASASPTPRAVARTVARDEALPRASARRGTPIIHRADRPT